MDELKGGGSDPLDFAGSMTAAIEDELNKLLAADGKHQLPADPTTEQARDRHRFIAAIARGVIRHLKEHPEALQVTFTHVPSPHSAGQFSAHVEVQCGDVP